MIFPLVSLDRHSFEVTISEACQMILLRAPEKSHDRLNADSF